ncbi:MAG: esterase-like activity of phytase family protein [Pirellulales bacterium]
MSGSVKGLSPSAVLVWAIAITAISDGAEATLESVAVIQDGRSDATVPLGGLSDLASAADGSGRLWATTDRGPNGTSNVGGKKRRTLLSPAFAPEIISIKLSDDAVAGTARVEKVIPLVGRSGKPLSGRPNGIGRDEPILDAASGRPIPGDPNGVDTEGIVQMKDGTFWMVEEYRPSLLRVSAAGRVLERFVPEGTQLDEADAEIRDVLPAAYGTRRDNRGFESIATSPDGTRLWTMLQSPLDNGKSKEVKKAGNVRLLAFDPSKGKLVAEHVYRLGDPTDSDYLTKGVAPADGKLCAMSAIDADSLLVIESDDTGLVRLYRADLVDATDTLPRASVGDGPMLEEIRDLIAAGIRPLKKTLVANLAPLVPAMRRDVYGGAGASADANADAPLKLEGLAILGPDRVAIVNDNDFGVHVKPGAACRSCLWVIRLGEPLCISDTTSAR